MTHEWLRSPPYVLRFEGYDLLYGPGNALTRAYSLNGFYEEPVMHYLRSSLPPRAIVIDVGANIGFFTLAALSNCEGATVHAFEPSPNSFALFSGCLSRNNLTDRVTANQLALSSEPGEMDFYLHSTEYGAYDGFRDTRYSDVGDATLTKVPVTTLDIYADKKKLKRLDLLKIDAEGAELSVLKGGRKTLSMLRPVVLFEVGYQNLRPYDILPSDLHQFFQENGYGVADLRGNKLSAVHFAHACVSEHEFIACPNI